MSNDKQLKSDDQQTSLKGSERDRDATRAGGNVILTPGNGEPSGNIVFNLANEREMIRFDHDGKVYVRGELVDDNQEIYMHFRRWMQLACIIPSDGN